MVSRKRPNPTILDGAGAPSNKPGVDLRMSSIESDEPSPLGYEP